MKPMTLISYRVGALVGGKLVLSESKMLDPTSCPNVIWAPEHYRAGMPCKCYEASATEMQEWGYTWTGKAWESQDD